MSAGRALALGASAVMLAAVVAGLWINGSPADHRDRRVDEVRVADLRALEVVVGNYHGREGRLPSTLEQMVQRLADDAPRSLKDPEDGQPYGFRALDANRFELCATFRQASDQAADAVRLGGIRPWQHGAGRHCFIREVESAATQPE